MTVIYAEKPDLGRKIAAALGSKPEKKEGWLEFTSNGEQIAVTWGFGHMYGLRDAKLYDAALAKWNLDNYPFFPERYQIDAKKTAKAQIKVINKLFKQADLLVNAADADREGELIFAYVAQAAGVREKPVKRLWLHSYLPSDIRTAYSEMKDGTQMKRLENAARTRAVVDWSIGINMTIYATKLFPSAGKEPVSIGRVQTPTLAMLVDRELAIRAFESRPFWQVLAHFTAENGEYDAIYKTEQIFDKAEAERILSICEQAKTGVVSSVEIKREQVLPPRLYNLTELQKEMNRQYGFTAKQTLASAQKLYESQLISYPRSSSQYLPESMKAQAKETISKLKDYVPTASYANIESFAPFTKRHFDDSKLESHYAIIPTGKLPKGLPPQEEKLYKTIALSLIRIAYPPAILEKLELITTVAGFDFKSSGKRVVEPGWMAVDAMPKEVTLPKLTKGETVSGDYSLREGKTEPPKRYTDASLINAMAHAGKDVENDDAREWLKETGIGTEATRASIIETLIQRGFALREKKSIIPTEFGIALIGYLPIETLKSPELTGIMEKRLHGIEDGTESALSVAEETKREVISWCAQMKATGAQQLAETQSEYLCPLCKEKLITAGGRSYNCNCGFKIYPVICGKQLTSEQLEGLLGGETIFVKNMRSKAGKSFSAGIKLDVSGKLIFEFEKKSAAIAPDSGEKLDTLSEQSCPVCGKALDVSDGARLKCECGFSLQRKICGKLLSLEEFSKLASKESVKVTDMISKKGKKFNAILSLDPKGKLSFEFEERKKSDIK